MEGRWLLAEPFSNMDSILDVLGMTDPQIKGMISQIKPEIILTPSGDSWNYKMVTPHNSREVQFVNGQEIDYVSIVGKPVKSVMAIDGNVLKEVHNDPANAADTTVITRTFDGDIMNVTLQVKDLISVGKYQRA